MRFSERSDEARIHLPAGTIPPIVEPAIWAATQERLRLNKERVPPNNHSPEESLLRGGYVRCGYCESTMIVRRSKSAFAPAHYQCHRANNARLSCSAHAIGVPELDKAV